MKFIYVVGAAAVLAGGLYLGITLQSSPSPRPQAPTPSGSKAGDPPPDVTVGSVSEVTDSKDDAEMSEPRPAESGAQTGASGRAGLAVVGADTSEAPEGPEVLSVPPTPPTRRPSAQLSASIHASDGPALPETPASPDLPETPDHGQAGRRRALSEDEFRSAVDSWEAPDVCGERYAEMAETAGPSSVRLAMRIDARGQVVEVDAGEVDSPVERKLVSCLEAHVASLRFPSRPGGPDTTRDATFVF